MKKYIFNKNLSNMKGSMFQLSLFIFLLFLTPFEAKIDFSSYDGEILNFIKDNFQTEDPASYIDKLRKIKITENDSKELINSLKKMVERYVYLDIIKNPPQPKENYFNTIDLIEELGNVKTEERPLYDFVRDINLIISNCQDLHFSFTCNRELLNGSKLREISFLSPIHYHVTKNGVYSKLSKYYGLFDKDIENKIREKENVQIKTINGFTPLEFIQKINKGFQQLKSPQAQFVLNFNSLEDFGLGSYQFEIEDVINIKILYEDNSELTYNYRIGFANKTNKLFFDYYIKHINPNPETDFRIFDISKRFMIENNFSFKQLKQQISWDKEIYNENRQFIKCKTDSNKGINVILQDTFLFVDNIDECINGMFECFQNFYENDYPIVIIEDYNGGGSTLVCDYLIALVNLNKPLSEYSSFKYNDDVKKYIASEQKYRTIDTCESKKADNYFDEFEIDDYGVDPHGQKIQHKRTKMFSATGTDRVFIEDNKKNLKTKIRKPNQIIIFTDGFSFSATSDFIKTTYLAGGAIIVGYGGNPNFETFDSCQNPASVLGTENMKRSDDLSKKIEDLGFSLRITYKEYFDLNYKSKPQIPLEFQIHEIDERFQFYEKYSDDHYNDFMEHAKYIFDKYKEECNPKNKKLLFITDDCVFDDELMHGGYECGDDGKWTKNCVASYCDNGYYYDKTANKCIEENCLIKGKEYKIGMNLFISSMVFFGLFLISVIVYIVLICKKNEKKNYVLFILIPFLIIAIILVMIATLKYGYP